MYLIKILLTIVIAFFMTFFGVLWYGIVGVIDLCATILIAVVYVVSYIACTLYDRATDLLEKLCK